MDTQAITVIESTESIKSVTPVTLDAEDMQLVETWLYGKAETTQRAYRRFAYELLAAIGEPLRMLSPMDVKQYAMTFQGETGTIAYRVNALKSLFTYATELNYLPVNLGKLLKAPKVKEQLAKRILTEEDMKRMIAAETNPRNHALLRLLYHTGMRVSEVVGLKWEDVHATSEGAVLDVLGKGEKQRYIPIGVGMYDELRRLSGQVGKERYVFQSRKGKAGAQPMDTRQVDRIIRIAAKRVDIDANVSAHWFRHANASHALSNGATITVVQQSLGHASLVTTTKYLHVRPGEGTSQFIKD